MTSPTASPWLETLEAAAYVRCLGRNRQPSRPAFRVWARRHGITFIYRGRRVLVARADLDRVLLGDPRRPRRQRDTAAGAPLPETKPGARRETPGETRQASRSEAQPS